MSDMKLTRILMDMAVEETKIAEAHLQKAQMLRALAGEIDTPDQPSSNPKPSPKPSDKAEAEPDMSDDELDNALEDEIRKAALECLTRFRGTTARPTLWPF